jgi:predicted transcriptional regulator
MATKLSATECESDDSETDRSLLELLGDEYTRRVLSAVTDQPRSGTGVVDATGVSKATAYRRLDDLEAAGLVDSEMVFDPDGYHHEQYYAVVESIDIRFKDGGVTVDIETSQEGSPEVAGRR